MIVSLVVAVDEQGGIGKDNRLPWHLRSDLIRFKNLTMHHHVVMGRKTYETIGKSLPGRRMVIVTRQKGYSQQGCTVVHSLQQAIDYARQTRETELFIIGGGEIFRQAIDLADKIYLTTVHVDVRADVSFPTIDSHHWQVSEKHTPFQGESDEYPSDFKILIRKD